jgi:FtsP/CotA-like multicopper oxidase with cupredoxin domain
MYNPFSLETALVRLNLINPLRKVTIYISGNGYVVLRFKADNEGIWMFHCHILWHRAGGMAMAFQVLGDEIGILGRAREGALRSCAAQMRD